MGRSRVVDVRTLNRTLLQRQHLDVRRRASIPRTITHLVAMQAQEPRDPYVALWSRIEGFDPRRLSAMLEDRRAVRMTLLRGTLHLVTTDDGAAIRPMLQPTIEGTFFGSTELRRALDGMDTERLLSFVRSRLEAEPHTRADLVRAIAERWPDRDASSLAYAMYLLPTVQVTPRGLWRRSGRAAFSTFERWTGRPTAAGEPADLVRRYLRAFGPATSADIRTWSGLRGLRELLEELRPRLRTFRDLAGRELFDVPRAPIRAGDAPAPVRFLPEFDNVLLAHEDRSRIVGEGTTIWTEVGWGCVLVGGYTAARWKLPRDAEVMQVEPFRKLSAAEREEIRAEGERLLRWLMPEAARGQVRIGR